MPIARKDIVRNGEEGVYHCYSRCVRRAFLCGQDPYSGRDYEHRRAWVQDRMKWLADSFCIDIVTLSVMSNHTHVILRTRPDLLKALSDQQVARRWLRSLPKRYDQNGVPFEPDENEVARTAEDPVKIAVLRSRLTNISYLMAAHPVK